MARMSTPTPQERLAARARRVALMRRRVIAAACASFALAWAVIAHSGSMGTQAAACTSAAGGQSAGTAATSDDQGTVTSDDDSGTLTTAQS
jgi:hypothetical protein